MSASLCQRPVYASPISADGFTFSLGEGHRSQMGGLGPVDRYPINRVTGSRVRTAGRKASSLGSTHVAKGYMFSSNSGLGNTHYSNSDYGAFPIQIVLFWVRMFIAGGS